MRAVKIRDGRPVTVECPAPAGAGVVVDVISAGVCGSDLHLLDWGVPYVLGHEMAGTLHDGTPVAIEPIAPCGDCPPCTRGDYHLCHLGASVVMGVGRDGGMAERCLVPESSLVRLPAGIALGDACLVEPLAVAVHGVRRGRVAPGQRTCVVGGGSIGQLALVALQAVGVGASMEARHEHQRDVAERLGALEVDGDYDVVIEAAGTTSALARAVDLVRPGGTVVLLGTYWEPPQFPALAVSMKEVDLVPAYMYSRSGPARDFDVAAAILSSRPEVASHVISHRFPLDACAEAFATARDRGAGAIKVVLEP